MNCEAYYNVGIRGKLNPSLHQQGGRVRIGTELADCSCSFMREPSKSGYGCKGGGVEVKDP